MAPETKSILFSNLWKLLGAVIILALSFVSDNIGLLHLDPTLVILISYAITGISEFVNKKFQLGKRALAGAKRLAGRA